MPCAGCRGDRGSQQQHQPASLRPESGTPVSSHQISGTSILWRSSTVKTPGLGASLKPLTTSTACSVNTSAELRPMLASTLSFWEWEVPSTALIVKASDTSQTRSSKHHQACCEASCSYGSICLLVPDALLRKFLLQVIIKTRNGVLLVILLIPNDFFCFL